MRSLTVGLAVAVAMAFVPAAAQASTFSGKCNDIAGTAKFGHPLNSTQADNTYDFAGTAHCDGTVNGKDVKGAPVALHVAGPGNMSCAKGDSTASGKGAITFKDTGVVIPFLMDFTATASEVTLTLKGIASGTGSGNASFFNKDPNHFGDNLTTIQNCGGEGNKELSFTASATADKLDDGASSGGSAPSSSASGGGSSTGSSGGGDSSGNAPTSGSSQTTVTTQSSDSQSKPKAKHKAKKKHKAKHKKHKAKKH
jgi:hypothetical protein